MKADYKVGDRVALLSYAAGNCERKVRFVTIDRETKLYWIVEDYKFRKSDGTATGDYGLWVMPPELLPADHEIVAETLDSQKERRLRAAINAAWTPIGGYDIESLERLILAADAYKTYLEEKAVK